MLIANLPIKQEACKPAVCKDTGNLQGNQSTSSMDSSFPSYAPPGIIMEYPRRIVLGLCMNLRRTQIAEGTHLTDRSSFLANDGLRRSKASQTPCQIMERDGYETSITAFPTLKSRSGNEYRRKQSRVINQREKLDPQISALVHSAGTSYQRHQSFSSHHGAGMTTRKLWRTTVLVLFYLLILVDSSMGCGPGRGAGRRRAPRKLTPLVYKQHVPNVPENTLSASGLNEGKINRDHPRFKALVPNYNSDIIFRDDEGTGADRLMTQRCKEKLNTLAISVMNQWPGVRLRVIEGWDEGNHHSTSSLHYEGRAVDITTSDKDRSKYGMLARLAVEAGFDWVYYESRAHIHCSVKSDSSQAARTGGCFSKNATVMTLEGRKRISDVQPGDSLLSVNEEGKAVFSEVLMFLDRNSTEAREFYHVTTSSGTSLSLTPSHLLYKVDRVTGDGIERTHSGGLSGQDVKMLYSTAQVTFAKHIEAGDWLLVLDDVSGNIRMEKVVHMEASQSTGVYAPLTKQGNVVVDGILASCYAVIDDQALAHLAFSPVRLLVNVYEGIGHAWRQFSRFVTCNRPIHFPTAFKPSNQLSDNSVERTSGPERTQADQGVHWYASFLYAMTKHLLPSHLLYDSE